MAKQGAASAKKPTGAAPAKKPTAVVPANNKNKPPTKAKPAAPPEPEKRKRVTHPAGTAQTFVLPGELGEIEAVWQGEVGEEKLCCPTCYRHFPVRAQAQEAAVKRKEKLVTSAQANFRHIARMLRKNAQKLGEPIPTAEEIAALMVAAADEEDEDLETAVDA